MASEHMSNSPLPFFIVGCPRSGTTLLASLLERNPLIAIPPETHFLNRTAKEFFFSKESLDSDLVLQKLGQNQRLRDLDIDWNEFAKRHLGPTTTLPETFVSLLHFFAEKSGRVYPGEKTPGHIDHVDKLIQWYPTAPIIWLVRDGRDVVRSLINVPWTHSSMRRHSLKWVIQNRQTEMIAQRTGTILRVKYEDLLLRPDLELRRIYQHLSIPFNNDSPITSPESKVIPDWEKPWKAKASTNIDATRAYSWKRNASPQEIGLLESVMRNTLREFDYPMSKVQCHRIRRLTHGITNRVVYLLYETPLRHVFSWCRRQAERAESTMNYLLRFGKS